MTISAPACAAQPPLHAGQRHFSRARLNLPARLVTFAGTTSCTLIDLSRSGAKIGAAQTPRVGAMVVIEGLPLELFGTVRWRTETLFGFEFDTDIPLEKVIAMRQYGEGEQERQKCAQITYARDWVRGDL